MQEAITCANVDPDLCCDITSLGHNVLVTLLTQTTYHQKGPLISPVHSFIGNFHEMNNSFEHCIYMQSYNHILEVPMGHFCFYEYIMCFTKQLV